MITNHVVTSLFNVMTAIVADPPSSPSRVWWSLTIKEWGGQWEGEGRYHPSPRLASHRRGRSWRWSWCSKYLVTSLQSVGKQKPEPSLSSERCGNVTPLTSQSPYQCNCRAPHFCPVLILLPHQEFALVRCNAIISGIQLRVQSQSCGLWVLSRLFTNYKLEVRITPPARSWYNESLYKSFSAKFYCSQRTYYPTFLSLLHQNEN